MKHIELARDLASFCFEHRFLCRPIDRDERVTKVELNVVFLGIAHQRRDIIGYTEEHSARIAKLDVDIVKHACAQPVIAGQIHRLLRCARAFDRHGRLRENGAALLELLHHLPCVRRKVIAVV